MSHDKVTGGTSRTDITEVWDPAPDDAQGDVIALLMTLSGPTAFCFSGRDRSRCRMMVTLLHGNEPSGVHALHRWILEQRTPETDLIIVVAAVGTALTGPCFTHRMLPGNRDLNRCFRPPFDGEEGGVAKSILDYLAAKSPEALIDVHNTSGSGPAFGVCPHWDVQHEALVSLFAPRMVISELSLGALMEVSDDRCPTVTIEVGGRQDEASHDIAFEGLCRFATEARILALPGETDWGMEIFRNSVRIELQPHAGLIYQGAANEEHTVTLRPDIERYNFGSVSPSTALGWCATNLESAFRAIDHTGQDRLASLLRLDQGVVYPANPLRLFMVTTHPGIAKSDCLMYAVCDAVH